MTYNQLKYFNVACRYNNLSRAAEKLYVSQPSISLAIKELEDELGESLFFRNNNKIYLTEAGRMLWEMSEGMLTQMELMRDNITKQHMETQNLAIGIAPEIANWVLPYVEQITEKMVDKYPNLDVSLIQMISANQDKMVLNHKVDIAFCNGGGLLPSGLGSKVITRPELKVIMREQHSMTVHEKISLSMLRDVILIGDYIDEDSWQDWVKDFFKNEDFVPKTRYFFTQNEAARWILLNKDVIAFGRPRINGLNMDGLTARPFDPPQYVDIIAVYDNRYIIRNIVADFLQLAKKVADPERVHES